MKLSKLKFAFVIREKDYYSLLKPSLAGFFEEGTIIEIK